MSARRSEPQRRLSENELSLWKDVTRSVQRLSRPQPAPDTEAATTADAKTPPGTLKQKRAAAGAQVKEARLPAIMPLGRRLRQRLARGTESIDRRIDLHGLTQDRAYHALVRFLRAAQAAGAKTVLVVTGKGTRDERGDPFTERGILRRLVPQWLNGRELRDCVLGFDSAHFAHGGEGALYVRLRRRRGAKAAPS